MLRHALAVAALGSLCYSSNAWALSQSSACRPAGRPHSLVLTGGPMCVLSQDPWQDCNEDPWQISFESRASDLFSDPWQDGEDPWQPFIAAAPPAAPADDKPDPWQPLVSRLVKAPAVAPDTGDDPWQPAFADPWQEGADDPWQLP